MLEEYQEFPDAVDELNKRVYGLVQASRSWNTRGTNDLKMLGFEQSRADPCVFRTFVAGEMEAIRVVHLDQLLALAVTNEAMEIFVRELRATFKIKDLGGASYFVGCHITRGRAKKELKFERYLYT